jgi:hypothetical protein
MQRLEVSCAVRPIYGSLGAKGLNHPVFTHMTTLLFFKICLAQENTYRIIIFADSIICYFLLAHNHTELSAFGRPPTHTCIIGNSFPGL